MDDALTATSILAEATRVLAEASYRRVVEGVTGLLAADNARVFEDSYGIVAVIVYDTWEDLASGWPDAQGALVELLSKNMPSVEPKAWEGYLVLLTPGMPPSGEGTQAHEIRLNTVRLRKFVATGEELTSLREVQVSLLPLLPLEPAPGLDSGEDVLQLIPAVLASKGLDEEVTRLLIDFFRRNAPLLEGLHTHMQEQ